MTDNSNNVNVTFTQNGDNNVQIGAVKELTDIKTQIGTARDVPPETLEKFQEKFNAAFQDFAKGWSFKGVSVVKKDPDAPEAAEEGPAE